jgi:endonuclease-3 related protein
VNKIAAFYDIAFAEYGDLGWWPASDPFEVMVGAILTQNTNWKNVERAILNLKNRGLLGFREIIEAPIDILADAIRSSGYYNQKVLKLKRFVEWFDRAADGEIDALDDFSTEELRRELIGIKGIGPETADDIVLYALDRPVFVVDTYTYRIAMRHGWSPPEIGYDELAEIFTSSMPEDIALYKNFHAIIVEIGKGFCKKRKPLCSECPARRTLEEGYPLEIF